MKLEEILRTTALLVILTLAGCGSSSFNWEVYVNRFNKNKGIVSIHNIQANQKSPSIYAFGGWDPLGNSRIEEIIEPIVSRMKVSDSAGVGYNNWPKVMERIKQQYEAGKPIILVGYSAGGSDLVEVSNVLEKANIPVGALILDATHLKSNMFEPKVKGIENSNLIPENVYYIENYVTNGPFGGRNLTDADFKNNNIAGTEYKNIYIDTRHLDLLKEKHSNKYVESINRILEAYKRRK